MATTISKSSAAVIGSFSGNTTLPFDGIHEPGAYVCRWSGHLLRVPEDSINMGRTPRMSVIGPDALMVTKIDNDPYIPAPKARLLAANHDVTVNF